MAGGAVVYRALRTTGTSLVATNHVSMKIGVMFGSPETMPGGLKLQYAAGIICAFNTPHRIPKDIEKPVQAYTFRMRTSKNKTHTPQLRANVQVRIDDYFGVDIVPELAELGKAYDILLNKDGQPHKGGHFYYQGEPVQYVKGGKNVTAGSEAALIEALYQLPELRAQLEAEIRLAIQAENARDAIKPSIDLALLPDDIHAEEEDEYLADLVEDLMDEPEYAGD